MPSGILPHNSVNARKGWGRPHRDPSKEREPGGASGGRRAAKLVGDRDGPTSAQVACSSVNGELTRGGAWEVRLAHEPEVNRSGTFAAFVDRPHDK